MTAHEATVPLFEDLMQLESGATTIVALTTASTRHHHLLLSLIVIIPFSDVMIARYDNETVSLLLVRTH
eukprot:m.641641 g.641641  ORF g.641641 m.641641 type:complete len:69 (+) comp58345_c0_seq28:4055-4261(+)